jgi:hypothetical protein
MPNLISRKRRPLPDVLLEDLNELVTWDNNCYLSWTKADPEGKMAPRWFKVRFGSDTLLFGLTLEFWVPAWMDARGVRAILPAHLEVLECEPGRSATVALGMGKWSEVQSSLPRVARTCARLVNELWGPTESDGVLLAEIDYQPETLPTPFPELRTYGR